MLRVNFVIIITIIIMFFFVKLLRLEYLLLTYFKNYNELYWNLL